MALQTTIPDLIHDAGHVAEDLGRTVRTTAVRAAHAAADAASTGVSSVRRSPSRLRTVILVVTLLLAGGALVAWFRGSRQRAVDGGGMPADIDLDEEIHGKNRRPWRYGRHHDGSQLAS